jgi:diaminopimelate epimerase
MLVDPPSDADAEGTIQLYNSDGSIAEMSGNGTRCAAAFLIRHGHAAPVVRVRTGAGVKTLRLLKRRALEFEFEMNMGRLEITAASFQLPLSGGARDVTLLWVGNPQCAVPVDNFDFDWRAQGAEIERHAHFPNRTNVSFVKAVDAHTINVRFWERGAGETMSSGTGSTGAAAMAVARGWVSSPVRVLTPAGPIDLRFDGDVYLTGPAEIVAEGEFFLE